MTTDRPRRRIAVVSDAVYPWNTGGKEMRLEELLTRVSQSGIDVDVYTMRWWQNGNSANRRGITYHALCPKVDLYAGPRRSIWQAVLFAFSTLRLLWRRFDLIEADAIPFLHLYPVALVGKIRRRPVVVTWHEFWGRAYWRQYLGPAGVLAAFVERRSLHLADRVVAASQATADRIVRETNGRVEPWIVPNGVDLEQLSPAEDAGPASVQPLRLVVVGRLLDHKKVDAAIGTVRVLRQRQIPVTLRVIGEGPELHRLRALADRLDVTDLVSFSPFLADRTALLREICAASLMLFPSVREGFGMVALESLALGTPVITSNHPDNSARFLIEPGVDGQVCAPDPVSMADAVAASMPHLAQLSTAARNKAAGYQWSALTERLLAVYAA